MGHILQGFALYIKGRVPMVGGAVMGGKLLLAENRFRFIGAGILPGGAGQGGRYRQEPVI